MSIETAVLIAQGALALITISMFAIKPFRMWFLGAKEERKKAEAKDAAEYESVKCLLRSDIVRIYYANREKKEMHSFEFENVSMLYDAYKKMGGNSFVDKIWEKMQTWKIIP